MCGPLQRRGGYLCGALTVGYAFSVAGTDGGMVVVGGSHVTVEPLRGTGCVYAGYAAPPATAGPLLLDTSASLIATGTATIKAAAPAPTIAAILLALAVWPYVRLNRIEFAPPSGSPRSS